VTYCILKKDKTNRNQVCQGGGHNMHDCPLIDSRYVLDIILKKLNDYEDKGWIGIKNKDMIQKIAYLLRIRQAETGFKWVKGHSGDRGNEEADKLANIGANKLQEDEISTEVPEEWKLEGARLQALTFKEMYQHIREVVKEKPRKGERYEGIREDALDCIEEWSGERPTEEQMFKGIRKEPIEGKIGDFIWKMIHDSNRCGEYFKHFKPEAQYCECGEVESMNHIILECNKTHQRKIWEYIEKIWEQVRKMAKNEKRWEKPLIGLIRGIGAIRIRSAKGKIEKGLTRLCKILITEAVWIIWKGRNERVINEKEITEKELVRTMEKKLIERIEMDWLRIKWEKPGKKTEAKRNLEETWCIGEILASVKDNKLKIHLV
jgi:hypothetical protein